MGGETADTMSWLDMPPCGSEACGDTGGHGSISEISVEPLGQEPSVDSHRSEDLQSLTVLQSASGGGLVDGVPPSMLVGQGGSVAGDVVTVKHNAGFSLLSEFQGQWTPDRILPLKLLGKRFSFSVDLSKVGCACNLALYLIAMPARSIDGEPDPGHDRGGQPKYYCDANRVGGQWCPEIDIMEANTHAFQATPHKCDTPTNGFYGHCDRGGCSQNTRDNNPRSYGVGSSFTIDTSRPFKVQTDFFDESGTWTGMTTTLQQDHRTVVLEHANCESGYYERLSGAMAAGMSLRITYWGDKADDMAWMDMPPCSSEDCGASAGDATISHMSVGDLPAQRAPAWWASVMRRYEVHEPPASNPAAWIPEASGTSLIFTAAVSLVLLLLFAKRLRRSHTGWKRLKDEDFAEPRTNGSRAQYSHLLADAAASPTCRGPGGIAQCEDAEVLAQTHHSSPLRYKARTCDVGRTEM